MNWLIILVIAAAMIVFCVVLALYWWHKWHEMFLRGIYAVTGFIIGVIVTLVVLLVLDLLGYIDIKIG